MPLFTEITGSKIGYMDELHGDRDYRFLIPVVKSLKRLGGSGTPKEVVKDVIQHTAIPQHELDRVLGRGESAVANEIAWARWILVLNGWVDKSVHGVWSLTPLGNEAQIDVDHARRNVNEYNRQRRVDRTAASGSQTDDPPPDEAPVGDAEDLLAILKQLSAIGFERLCQRVLREAGFSEVHVTKQGGDGGIDGHGILRVNELVSFRVVFQCKRYASTVGAEKVRDFRGAMDVATDKAMLITTGTFTSQAEQEATRPGAQPIELVDGERLVALMERLQLGVRARTVYDVDPTFFDEYRLP